MRLAIVVFKDEGLFFKLHGVGDRISSDVQLRFFESAGNDVDFHAGVLLVTLVQLSQVFLHRDVIIGGSRVFDRDLFVVWFDNEVFQAVGAERQGQRVEQIDLYFFKRFGLRRGWRWQGDLGWLAGVIRSRVRVGLGATGRAAAGVNCDVRVILVVLMLLQLGHLAPSRVVEQPVEFFLIDLFKFAADFFKEGVRNVVFVDFHKLSADGDEESLHDHLHPHGLEVSVPCGALLDSGRKFFGSGVALKIVEENLVLGAAQDGRGRNAVFADADYDLDGAPVYQVAAVVARVDVGGVAGHVRPGVPEIVRLEGVLLVDVHFELGLFEAISVYGLRLAALSDLVLR